MKKNNEELTQAQISALFCAVNEKNITERSVIEELAPLIGEYFNCNYALEDDRLILRFLNGQNFALTVSGL